MLVAHGRVRRKLQQLVKHGRPGRRLGDANVNCTYLVAITKGSRVKNRILWILLAAAAITGGCAVVPANGPYSDDGYDYGEPVVVAPPPPRVEYVRRPPVVGQIWIGGYWNWTGRHHAWVPGHWEAPRRGHHWAPHRWYRDGNHWRQEKGRWERDERRRPQHGSRDDDRRGWR